MTSLVGIHQKEEGLTLAQIKRKTQVLRTALQSNQSSLRDLCRSTSRYPKGGGSDDQVVSMKRAADEK